MKREARVEERSLFEEPLRALVGEQIARVRYFEIDYFDGQAHWFDDPRFDSLDFGLILELSSGGSLAVTWGNEFASHGLSFNAGLLPYHNYRTAGVTRQSRWQSLLDVAVADVEIEWTPNNEPGRSASHYPTVARIGFEDGRSVYLLALEIRGDQLTADDHITVDFDGDVVREMSLWSP